MIKKAPFPEALTRRPLVFSHFLSSYGFWKRSFLGLLLISWCSIASASSAVLYSDPQTNEASEIDDKARLLVASAMPKNVIIKSIESVFVDANNFTILSASQKMMLKERILLLFDQDWPLIEALLVKHVVSTYDQDELQKLWEFEKLRTSLARSKMAEDYTLITAYKKALENPLIADYASSGLDYYVVQPHIEAIFQSAYRTVKSESKP